MDVEHTVYSSYAVHTQGAFNVVCVLCRVSICHVVRYIYYITVRAGRAVDPAYQWVPHWATLVI